ncbi:MAG: shikimate kinase [Lachnospiraceae bacterium]|jgi:shikimate kinase|nr:shikimate kinase [Lachnospiraceae bacterium]
MGNNIVLIGMPGAGKSTMGVVLAKVNGMDFIDADLLIQAREKRLLSQILEQDGVDGFLRVEDEVNASIQAENAVIATGGSVVYCEKAMEHLRRIGTVVYLRLSYSTIESRLFNIRGRGVALREGQTLRDLYEERCVLYEKYAHVTVDEEGLGIEETVEKTLQVLKMLLE